MDRPTVAVAAVLIAACSPADPPPAPAPSPAPHPVVRVPTTTPANSTIAAADYIGPAACGECHPNEHAAWSRSLHAVMNQRATAEAVVAPLPARFAYRGGTVEVSADRVMTLARGDERVRYRITRTIGKRGLQELVGVGERGVEVRLPFGYWPRRRGWYPQPYFDAWLTEDFDPFAEVREPWAERCPWCHSTYPFAQRISRSTSRDVGHGLEQHFELAGGAAALAVDQQVTVGISCESCHLGGRAHAAGSPIHFVPIGAVPKPRAPAPTTFADERRDPAIANAVCAQCHSGPSPRFADGTATRNSSEALDLGASACRARCVDCHDPHRADARATGANDRAVAACTRCHDRFADRELAGVHAGHTTASCLDCHMPRLVLGIDRFVRTHRISSPGDPEVFANAPNACNLCHLDRSLAWTAGALATRYRRVVRATSSDPAGPRWLASAEPAIRLIAAAAYGRSPLGRAALPVIARLLDDPLPYVRSYAVFSIEEILGRTLTDADYDPRLPAARRGAQIARLLE